MTTRKLTTALAALVAAVGTAGAATVAHAATSAKISISATGADDANRFSGFVTSSRDSCHNGRTVYLYKQRGRTRSVGRDTRVGSDRATPNQDGSQYSIATGQSGRFYAYVKATRSCNAAFSKVVSSAEDD